METDQEVKELKENLKQFKVKPLKLRWRLLLLIIILIIALGGYFLW